MLQLFPLLKDKTLLIHHFSIQIFHLRFDLKARRKLSLCLKETHLSNSKQILNIYSSYQQTRFISLVIDPFIFFTLTVALMSHFLRTSGEWILHYGTPSHNNNFLYYTPTNTIVFFFCATFVTFSVHSRELLEFSLH